MYIALCLVVNIKCIVCVCFLGFFFCSLKGGGSKLIANQAGKRGQAGFFLCPMSCFLEEFKGKKKRKRKFKLTSHKVQHC